MEERQITLTRLIAVRPETLWRCWTDPELLPRWFGPEGYICRTKEIRLGEGGIWRFDMIGPEGKIWPNRHRYFGLVAGQQLEFWMDGDDDAGPAKHVQVVLAAEPGGTRITQVMTFPDAASCVAAKAFGAEALGQTTLAKLAALAEGMAAG